MSIVMSCIDTGSAPLAVRELFACTGSEAAAVMRLMRTKQGVDGCIVYSTCNRTEIWLDADIGIQPAELLCSAGQVPYAAYKSYFHTCRGQAAVRSLFLTAAGLSSKIWGETQILGQVKHALELAVQEKTGGNVLNKLFQYAVTAAKQIRTNVRVPENHASVASETVAVLQTRIRSLSGVRCLVIGSGDMGRSAARALAASGADVTITLGRHHKSEEDIRCIPEGCRTVPYDERAAVMNASSVIVSATTSPHYTVKADTVAALNPLLRIFVDLAVPRDVEPAVSGLPYCTLLTIDDIPCSAVSDERKQADAAAQQIIDRYVSDFYDQLSSWECLPEVELLSGKFAGAMEDFIRRELSGANSPDRDAIAASVGVYAQKKGQALLFSFRRWFDEYRTGRGEQCRP